MKRSHFQIAISMLAVFLSGILVGGFAFRLYTVRTVSAAPRVTPDDYRRKYVAEITSRLHLDAAQSTRLNAILDETRARTSELKKKHKPEFVAIHDEHVRNIRAMLNESQNAEYERFLKEREAEQKAKENAEKR